MRLWFLVSIIGTAITFLAMLFFVERSEKWFNRIGTLFVGFLISSMTWFVVFVYDKFVK